MAQRKKVRRKAVEHLCCNAECALYCEWSSGADVVASTKPFLSPGVDAEDCLSLRSVCPWEKNV